MTATENDRSIGGRLRAFVSLSLLTIVATSASAQEGPSRNPERGPGRADFGGKKFDGKKFDREGKKDDRESPPDLDRLRHEVRHLQDQVHDLKRRVEATSDRLSRIHAELGHRGPPQHGKGPGIRPGPGFGPPFARKGPGPGFGAGMPPHGFGGFGPGQAVAPGAAFRTRTPDLDRKLERLEREVDELRRELRQRR